MFFGVDVYPARLDRTTRVLLTHGIGGPLRVQFDLIDEREKRSTHKVTIADFSFQELLYLVGADLKSSSIVVDLPRGGPCIYWTLRGEYFLEGEEIGDGIRQYLDRLVDRVRKSC